jgi:hypothetical protein
MLAIEPVMPDLLDACEQLDHATRIAHCDRANVPIELEVVVIHPQRCAEPPGRHDEALSQTGFEGEIRAHQCAERGQLRSRLEDQQSAVLLRPHGIRPEHHLVFGRESIDVRALRADSPCTDPL